MGEMKSEMLIFFSCEMKVFTGFLFMSYDRSHTYKKFAYNW